MEKIDEVYIIEDSGVCLFNHSIGKEGKTTVDETLFSGFLSSIQTFLETISKGEKIKRIELGGSKLLISSLEEYHIFIVLRSSGKIKEKYLKKKIEEIQKQFIINYGSYLVEHQVKKLPYNTQEFQGFHEVLKDIFEEEIDKNISNWMSKF